MEGVGNGARYERGLAIETVLDRSAAAEPVFIGVDLEKRGHAWMKGADRGAASYDVELSV